VQDFPPPVDSPETKASRGIWKSSYRVEELSEVSGPGGGSQSFKDLTRELGIVISRCHSCRLVYTRTPIHQSQSHYLASKEDYLAKYGAIFRGQAPHPRDRNYDEQLRLLERFRGPGDLLDVGSHCGFFLRRARARGWQASGVEPSPVSACLAREQFGLDVKAGRLEDTPFPDWSFDVVTLIDVLEHVGNPRQLLGEVARVLRPDGLVCVKVPNVRYVLAKHYLLGRSGVLKDTLDAREHLVHYSARTLARTLAQAGLALQMVTVPSPIHSGGRLRRGLRVAASAVARYAPGGAHLPLAPDLLAIARSENRRPR
jgi:SAM-dependent methyltransferase